MGRHAMNKKCQQNGHFPDWVSLVLQNGLNESKVPQEETCTVCKDKYNPWADSERVMAQRARQNKFWNRVVLGGGSFVLGVLLWLIIWVLVVRP